MIYLIIATICFSFSFGLIKNQLSGLPADIIVELRLIVASLFFLPFLKIKALKTFLKAGLIGIIQFGLMYIFFLRAFKYLQGNEIVLLTASTPILVAICSGFIEQQRFKLVHLVSVILSVLGAVIVIWNNTRFSFLINGVLLMGLSNFCFALGQVLWRKYIGEADSKLMFAAYFTAAVFIFPIAFINTNIQIFSLNFNQWLTVLYLGIVPTGIGFWLWNKGAKLVNSTVLAVMNNLKIPMGGFFALVFFHERINLSYFIFGSSLILIGIILSSFFVFNKRTTQST
jgi:drug/metabolite transporter (DMT)-like permease